MGIESTNKIKRDSAIERIKYIFNLIEEADWVELHKIAEEEDDGFVYDYVDRYNDLYNEIMNSVNLFKSIDKFPNKYLEYYMDKMGIRFSMFENYFIED